MNKEFDSIIIGAGIVGVSSALSLALEGQKVLLLDKNQVCQETSFGNAGVISSSSMIPINSPWLLKDMFSLMKNNSLGFKYDLSYVLKNINHMMRFLSYATEKGTQSRAEVLNHLISHSRNIHQQWLAKTNQSNLMKACGWMKLYQTDASFQKAQTNEFSYYQNNNVSFEVLDADDLKAHFAKSNLNHHLEKYIKGVFFANTALMDSPVNVVTAYLNMFLQCHGTFIDNKVGSFENQDEQWIVKTSRENYKAKNLILTTGPFTNELLKSVNLKLPLIYENGSHIHFDETSIDLPCPIYDVDQGYVLSPMNKGIRMTTGVYLNHYQYKNKNTMIESLLPLVKKNFGLNATEENKQAIWYGTRPTLPDSMPAIGETTRKGLWLACGHQHIGLSTGPESARLLSKLITKQILTDKEQSICKRLSPARFNI